MSHDHRDAGATGGDRRTRRLAYTLGLTSVFLVIEVAGGIWTGSLALLADAGHMLTDVGGLALALFAIWFAAKPATSEKTYGYYRVEILAALVNAVVLLGVAVFILYEAYERLLNPPAVLAVPMLAVAVVGLAVNLVAIGLLHRGAGESLNVKGAYLEVVSDALGSLGVIIAALIVWTTGWRLADPIIAGGIGIFIVPRTWSLLRQAVNVLLEGVPPHVDLAEVDAAMRSVSGVRSVHDLHVWTLTSGRHAMSAHVQVEDRTSSDRILEELHVVLHDRFDIDHTTIQIEAERLVQIAGPGESQRVRSREGDHR